MHLRIAISSVALVWALSGCASTQQTRSLEQRVAALEREAAGLKEENRQMRESAVTFLSAELTRKEREGARLYYRTQILPVAKTIAAEFGTRAPTLPKEEEINTMAEAYRPILEMIMQLLTVADGK